MKEKMRKFLLFITSLFFTLNSFAQVKINVWDKSPRMAQTVNKMNAAKLPRTFESVQPDGEIEIYDKLDVPNYELQTSSGKKTKVQPTVYKARKGFGAITYSQSGWSGHYSRGNRSWSMSPSNVTIDTTRITDFNCSQIPSPPTKSSGNEKPTPPTGRTLSTNADFYNKNLPINKTLTFYLEVTNGIRQSLGGTSQTTDFVNNLFANTILIYQNEGLTIQLNKVYIWETNSPYDGVLGTAQQGLIPYLSAFSNNISLNNPTTPNAFFKHLICYPGNYGGLAFLPFATNNGYDVNSPGNLINPTNACGTGAYFANSGQLPNGVNITRYFWNINCFAHEIGHNMGSKHTHWCGWKNDAGTYIGRLDSCGSGTNEQNTNPTGTNTSLLCNTNSKFSKIPTIMSYCYISSLSGFNSTDLDRTFINGFGKYPRHAIRNTVYNTTNIPFSSAVIPTVTTTSASSIVQRGFVTGGNVTSDGGAAVTERGVVYSTSTGPSIGGSGSTKVQIGTGLGVFSSTITNLTASTTYYIRSYAVNQAGIAYGNEVTVTTLSPVSPTVSTSSVTSVTNTNATSGGSISNDGGASITVKGVCWSTSPNPTVALTTKTNNGTGTASFTSSLTGLSPLTTYYVRAYATNSAGTGYGNEITFTTISASSILITTNATNAEKPTSATTSSTITSDGGSAITQRGFCWNTSPNPTTSNFRKTVGTGTGTFSTTITGLTENTLYYLRSYAINANGTTYGNEVSFTTFRVPQITISNLTFPTAGYARFTATVTNVSSGYTLNMGKFMTDNGSTPDPFTNNVNVAQTINPTPSPLVNGTYTFNIPQPNSGVFIQPNTTYNVRAYLGDVSEPFQNYYSNTLTATSPVANLPTVTTGPVTEATATSPTTSSVRLTSTDDNQFVIERGVCFSTSPNPTINDIKSTTLVSWTSPTTPFSYIVSLTPNNTYYVRAFARNVNGVGYGNERIFTIPIFKSGPTLGNVTVTNISQNGATFTSTVTNSGNGQCTLSGNCKGFVISKVNSSPSVSFSKCNTGSPNFLPTCGIIYVDPNEQSLLGQFSVTCNGCVPQNAITLDPGSTYYVRGFVCSEVISGATDNLTDGSVTNGVWYTPTTTFTTLSGTAAPTVLTGIVTNPTNTSSGSILNTVVANGGSTVTSRGIVWSTSPNPITTLSTKIISGSGNGDFTTNITVLTAGTLYYYRAWATNSVSTSYGQERTFTTTGGATIPVVSTTAISNLSTTTATSGGTISSQGSSSITSKGVVWSTSTSPTISLSTKTNDGTGTATFTSSITGLTAGTTYYLRAYATNSTGTAYGSQITFTTLNFATVATTSASNVTETTVTTGGNVTSDGGSTVTERGVCYATTSNPTTGNLKVTSGGGTGTFTTLLGGLLPSTTYYVRAYAINSVGTQYGSQITFTTSAQVVIPTVTTTSPTSITSTTATSGGNVTSAGNGTVSSRGVVWSTSTEPTISLTTKTSNGTGTGVFTSSITGLTPGVLYYLRAYATNSAGTSYGSETTFTTLTTTATLAGTTTATSITQNSAVSGGNVTSDGGSTVSARGICWSTSQNPTIALSTKTNDGSGVGSFISNITNLNAGTTYFVRSYATNVNGTNYGAQISFTTISATTFATVSTTIASGITLTGATTGGQVTADGGSAVTARGVVWSTSPAPTVSLTTKTLDGTGVGTFTSSITGLSPATSYFYRAYATNSNGTSYGSQNTFTTSANLPTLTTTSISSITLTSALSGGNITSDGGSSVTARGVIWSTSPNPTVSLSTKTNNGPGTGSFTSSITSLSGNTTYYVRSYATNSAGTAYGNELSFTTTSVSLPTVLTTSPTSINFTSAVSGGNVTSDGNTTVTSKGVCWSITQNPTISNSFTNDGTGTGSYSSNITNLSPGTTYFVRAYATNSQGTSYGTQFSFVTTPGEAPIMTTDAINNVTTNNAEVVISISSVGGGTMTSKGICYSTTPNPTTSNSKVEDVCSVIDAPCEIGQYTYTFLSPLSPGITYYVRAFGINEFGTSYGEELTFTTSIDFPTLSTDVVSSVTSNSAVSGGVITSTGGGSISAKGVCWSTSQNPTISNSFTNDGTGSGRFTSNITSLLSGTTYYVRSYATNEAGTNYGNQQTFTTSSLALPTVTTTTVTSITTTTATSGGNVTSDGGSVVTSRGVCWSTSQNPTIASNRTIDGSGLGTFSSSISGLSPGTTYFVRAYATTSAGTGYGSQVSFTTTTTTPTLSTIAISGITSSSATSGGSITSNGGATITSKGICWSTSPNPTIALSTKTNDGTGSNSFTSTLSSLTQNTLYYVRSYATNANGTSYGNQITFTTLTSGGGSCAITGLTVIKTGCAGGTCNYTFSFNVNPNCLSYTVNVCRYSNSNPAIPPTSGQTPIACAPRNNMTNYVPTAGEISSGTIFRVMAPTPVSLNFWYSVDVTCNSSTCTGPKTTRSAYFYNAP